MPEAWLQYVYRNWALVSFVITVAVLIVIAWLAVPPIA